MVVDDRLINQGDIYWADLPPPRGSEPGYYRPVIVVQQTALNNLGDIDTVICVPLTTNVRLASAPGNVLVSPKQSGLPKASVANVSQTLKVEKRLLKDYVSTVPWKVLEDVLDGVDFMLGR